MAASYLIQGEVITASDVRLQVALAAVYESPQRPRCLCMPGGVEMYVARHGEFLIKRMPQTGHLHHVSCPSFEPAPGASGLGELLGEAIIEHTPERVELRTAFPLERRVGRSVAAGERAEQPGAVGAPKRRMSLRALLHFLYDRAGFNRWYPAMAGKRCQAVIRHHLLAAAQGVTLKGTLLEERLYIPEQFRVAEAQAIAERRRKRLAALSTPDAEGQFQMAVLIGQFGGVDATAFGRRITIKHAPELPLYIDNAAWERAARAFGPIIQGVDADIENRPRILMAALIYAKRELLYQIDSLTMMLVTQQWIPLDGVHELPLVEALVREGRSFLKPLPFDAKTTGGFPNILLLDTADVPTPLHVASPFQSDRERASKEAAIKAGGAGTWAWRTDGPQPLLPEASRSSMRCS
jgi:hypothetical protein